MEIIAELETQTDRRVRVLRSDGGGEFCNSRLEQFCKGKGIVHQVTDGALQQPAERTHDWGCSGFVCKKKTLYHQ
jgi:hypothetical protein